MVLALRLLQLSGDWLIGVVQSEFAWSRDWFGIPETVAAGLTATAAIVAITTLIWRLMPRNRPTARDVTRGAFKYWAFISYSRQDEKWGAWLHRGLETYRVPRQLIGTAGRDGSLPNGLFPIFRDLEELPASADLGDQITEALEQSATLIVICSPNSAKSKWVNKEIATYKKLGRENRILAMIVDGEPNAASKAGFDPDLECFPPALKLRADKDGELTGEPMEPIAADTRKQGEGATNARVKVIAGVLGVSYDGLKRREDARRQRGLLAVTGVVAVATGALGLYVWQLYDRGTLVAQSEPADTAITIDGGAEVGGRVKGLKLPGGVHQLTAWSPWRFELSRSIRVPRQGKASTKFWLEPGYEHPAQGQLKEGELYRSNGVQGGLVTVPAQGDTLLAHNTLDSVIFVSTRQRRVVAEFPSAGGNHRSFQSFDLGGDAGKVIFSGLEAASGLDILAIKASAEPAELWRWQGPAVSGRDPAAASVAPLPDGPNVASVAVAGRDGQLTILDGRTGRQASKLQFSQIPLHQSPNLRIARDGNTAIVTIFFRPELQSDSAPAPPGGLQLHAISLSASTGEVRWQRDFGVDAEDPGAVFQLERKAHVVIVAGKKWQAIDLQTGQTHTHGELPEAHVSGGPAIAEVAGRSDPDLIFSLTGEAPALLAVRSSDGQISWRGPPNAKPVRLFTDGEGTLLRTADAALLAAFDDALVALDPHDGHVVWPVPVAGQTIGAIAGDWNGDGRSEIIAAMANVGLVCIDAKGRVLWTLRLENSMAVPRAMIPSFHGGSTRDIVMMTHGSAISLLHGPRVLWRYSAPAVQQATPVVTRVDAINGGRSVVIATVHEGGGRARLRAIDGIEGGVRWEAKEFFYPNRGATLAQLDGKGPPVVVALGWRPSEDGIHLFAYNPSNGALVRDVPTKLKGWFSSTPVVADFRGTGQSDFAFSLWEDKSIVMVDGRTGETVWRQPTSTPNMQGVSVADLEGNGTPYVVAASLDGNVYALRGKDGALLWKQPIEGGAWSQPVFAKLDSASNGYVLVVSLAGRLHVLDARTGAERWSPEIAGGLKVAGHPIVIERDGRAIIVAPLGAAGAVAFDWDSRRELWRSPAGYSVIASPVLADFWGEKGGSVVVGATSGDVFVLSAADGKTLWRDHVAGGAIEADPVVADLDGDGVPDLVIGAHDSLLHAVSGAGSLGIRR